ncbi:MAG: cation:proton antiporter [Candidatus Schekmanbacteria bacterium]|nr:MAG: cation:proton antiporter [Candidatus Schekmanbacteria bacterium]
MSSRNIIVLTLFLLLVFLPFFSSVSALSETDGAVIEGHNVVSNEVSQEKSAEHIETGHIDPVTPVLLWLIVILLGAKVGGEIFERIKQPPVLGELIAGVLIGNFYYLTGIDIFQPIASDLYIDIISRIGVIILLFEVGLESSLEDMMKVGWKSFWVATVGVIAPFVLGYFVSLYFFPEKNTNVHIFIGATLCATSVGITARVFKDLGKISSKEAQIVLGAAVIDDVMGLVILSIVSGIIISGSISLLSVSYITLKAVLFLAVGILAGIKVAPLITKQASKMKVDGLKIVLALSIAFLFSYVASKIGLAPIVGAFAAGLILEEVYFEGFKDAQKLDEIIKPISSFLVPVFFVLMGIQVKLETFTNVKILGVAAGITIAAFVGKQVCGFVTGKGVNRLCIGISMVPRGEVGLIFAAIGKQLGVVNDAVFSAVVIMVIVTTLITPPLIKFSLSREK